MCSVGDVGAGTLAKTQVVRKQHCKKKTITEEKSKQQVSGTFKHVLIFLEFGATYKMMDVCLGIRKARGEGFLAFACDTGDIMEYITLLHGYLTHPFFYLKFARICRVAQQQV